MSKNRKLATFEIDGKLVKQITKFKGNKEEWVKFFPISNKDLFYGFHFIKTRPNQNHIDVYNSNIKLPKIRGDFKPAGVLIDLLDKNKTLYKLPPLINSNNHFDHLTEYEKLQEYVKRIKLIKNK
jgi:hypothetical protein